MKLAQKYREHFVYQLASLISLILLLMLCAYFLMVRYSAALMRQNTLDMNERLLAQAESHVHEYWNNLYNVATAFCYSPTTLQYLSSDSLGRLPGSDELAAVFSNTLILDGHILSAYLYNAELEQVAAMGKEFTIPASARQLRDSMEIQADTLVKENGKLYYQVIYPIYDLASPQYRNPLGLCIFVLEPGSLDDTLTDSQATENTRVLLLDSSSRILAYTGETFLGLTFPPKRQKSNASQYFYIHPLTINNWSIASLIPEAELSQPDKMLNYTFIAVFLITLALFAALIAYYNWQITLPIQRITAFIQGSTLSPEKRLDMNRQDELGIVANSLNRMLDENQKMQAEIRRSQQRIYEAELAKRQVEILAYRNQINPHFLYNTFECIRGMALYRDADDIAEITMALANVFRFAVKGADLVSVEEEIDYILEYAKIIDYRFMGKISIDIEAEPDTKEKKVFKLLLQPLVENAVFHGLEQKITEGLVDVRIFSPSPGRLCFIVEDDGCGIEPERLKEILDTLDTYENTSKVGLFNIYQRLKLFYDNCFEFHIESTPGKGTCITILIPDDPENLQEVTDDNNIYR